MINDEAINENQELDDKITIVAIIPALNEVVPIGSMVMQTKEQVDHVIVVDDGSTDNTANVAKKAGANVIIHPTNKGKGEALKTGFMAATQNGAKIIVTLDGDGQHYPEDIPELIKPIVTGEADIVIGSRRLNGNKIPLLRRFGQYILDRMTFYNCRIKTTDTQSGFRAFAIHTVPAFKFKSKDFHIESEMLEDAADAGHIIKDVGIRVRYKGKLNCNTQNPFNHGPKVLFNIIKRLELRRPLIVFTYTGMTSVSIGLIMGVNFYERFVDGGNLSFGPTILMMLFLVLGTILIISGIILHAMTIFFQDIKEMIKEKEIKDIKEMIKEKEIKDIKEMIKDK